MSKTRLDTQFMNSSTTLNYGRDGSRQITCTPSFNKDTSRFIVYKIRNNLCIPKTPTVSGESFIVSVVYLFTPTDTRLFQISVTLHLKYISTWYFIIIGK